MENQIAKQIRTFRLRSDLTQEKLAEKLNVTAQAISKWENGLSYPDIVLLPDLTAILGITIDELFESSMETHLRRIEQMMECHTDLTDEDFSYAEGQLKKGCLDIETRGRCLTMLAELYNLRAESYHNLAAGCAKQALEIEPEKKVNHCVLSKAAHGVLWDWCCTNHTDIIRYYKQFVREHPRYHAGYLWLLDNLIADGRLDEAKDTLEQMRNVKDSYHYLLYKGWINEKGGNREEAEKCWDDMVSKYGDCWFAWSSRGDAYAKRAEYDRAIADFTKAVQLEKAPRFTDDYDSIAQLCILKGDKQGAIKAYEHVVEILHEDWGIQEGETINGYLQNISQLKRENG